MRGFFFSMVVLATLPLAGCSTIGDAWNGLWGATPQGALPYRAKLSRADDRRDFVVTVKAGGVGVDAVRESVRFPATRYCLKTYGGSEVEWLINPDTGDWSFAREGASMVFSGRCLAR